MIKTVNFLYQYQFFLDFFLRTCRMQFWQPCLKLLPNSVKLTLEFSKNFKKLCVIQEICSSFWAGPSVDVECSFDNRAWSFHQNPWIWRSNSQKSLKFLFYSRDLFFLGMIISWREMQFWPPCRNFSAKLRTYFDWYSKVIKTVNFFSQHQFFLEFLLRTCRMQFWQPCMKLPHQTP